MSVRPERAAPAAVPIPEASVHGALAILGHHRCRIEAIERARRDEAAVEAATIGRMTALPGW